MADWEASAGTGVTGVTGGTYVSSLGGMSGTSGLFETRVAGDGSLETAFDGRQVAMTAIRVCSAAAGGLATFASGPTCGAGAIAAGAIGMITTAVQGGFNAYDAQKTIAKLTVIRERVANKNSARGSADDRAALLDVLDGCIGKATNKKVYGVTNATGVGQVGVAATRTVRAIYKGVTHQKGTGRARRADALYELAKGSGPLAGIARETIEAICMANFEGFMKKSIADAMKS